MQRVRISFPETSSFGNGAQARENVRNSLGFNYKSATLSDRVTGTQCSDSLLFGARRGLCVAAATLYSPFLALNILADL